MSGVRHNLHDPENSKRLSILIISPNPQVRGGVTVFIETMKQYLHHCRAESYWVGNIETQKETPFALLRRIFLAPFHVVSSVWRRKPDVIHINPTMNKRSIMRDGLILIALRLINYRRILVYFHGYQVSFAEQIQKNPILRFLIAWILNGTARITVLGPAFQKSLIKIGVNPEKIYCTQTMFEGEALERLIDEESPTRRTIVFMSRFFPPKGAMITLKAFIALQKDFLDVDLILAGDGEEQESLRQTAAREGLTHRVLFPGYISGAEKWRVLRDCEFLVLPTMDPGEGMPVAVLEAMGAGKPVLVGPAGVLSSLVIEPENGIFLSHISVQEVESGMRRLLTDRVFAKTAGENNAKKAWTSYEARIVTREIESWYFEIATL